MASTTVSFDDLYEEVFRNETDVDDDVHVKKEKLIDYFTSVARKRLEAAYTEISEYESQVFEEFMKRSDEYQALQKQIDELENECNIIHSAYHTIYEKNDEMEMKRNLMMDAYCDGGKYWTPDRYAQKNIEFKLLTYKFRIAKLQFDYVRTDLGMKIEKLCTLLNHKSRMIEPFKPKFRYSKEWMLKCYSFDPDCALMVPELATIEILYDAHIEHTLCTAPNTELNEFNND
jgi:hypothetical protein